MKKYKVDKILMKDEEVLYIYKPCLVKIMVFTAFISIIILASLSLLYAIPEVEGETEGLRFGTHLALILGGIVVVFTFLFQYFAYRNKFYTVTNKRFIIQKGILGIDFSSIPIYAVQYVAVNVSVIDKMLRKGTGSITFGTVSTPVTAGTAAKFAYADITEVYENYKNIKELVDKSEYQEVKVEK